MVLKVKFCSRYTFLFHDETTHYLIGLQYAQILKRATKLMRR